MPRFVAVHTAPFTEEQLKQLATTAQTPPGVHWIATYSAFDDNRHFCEWVAPNKEVILEIFRQYNLPYDGLHVVRRFDPDTAQLEAA